MAGILQIHCAIAGSNRIGHSWIEYRPIDGTSTTYGTWGNDPAGRGNGLLENVERGLIRPTATRSKIIDHEQELRLFGIIEQYRQRGQDAWSLLTPCSTFAAEAWAGATGEHLVHQTALVSTPSRLAASIREANHRDAVAGLHPKSRTPRRVGNGNSTDSSNSQKRPRKRRSR
jgi:hypothetical protein